LCLSKGWHINTAVSKYPSNRLSHYWPDMGSITSKCNPLNYDSINKKLEYNYITIYNRLNYNYSEKMLSITITITFYWVHSSKQKKIQITLTLTQTFTQIHEHSCTTHFAKFYRVTSMTDMCLLLNLAMWVTFLLLPIYRVHKNCTVCILLLLFSYYIWWYTNKLKSHNTWFICRHNWNNHNMSFITDNHELV
jgi:hypothetical protein